MQMILPDGETIIRKHDELSIVLTTHRLLYNKKHKGWSVALEDIHASKNKRGRHPLFLWLAICSIATMEAFIFTSFFYAALLMFTLSIGFTLAYLSMPRNVVIVTGTNCRMVINMGRMNRDKVLSFINAILQAKYARSKQVQQIGYTSINAAGAYKPDGNSPMFFGSFKLPPITVRWLSDDNKSLSVNEL